jgi:hypothetical protein
VAIILATWKAEIRRIMVLGWPRAKKVCETPISEEKKLGVMCTPVISATQEA